MSDTETTERAATGLQLVDERGNPITPKQVRIKWAGNTHLSYDLEDLPPQHATVEVTLRGTVGGFFLDEPKDLGWVAGAKVEADEILKFRVVPPNEEPTLLDDGKWIAAIETLSQDTDWGGEQLETAARRARDDFGWTPGRFVDVLNRGRDLSVGPSVSPATVVEMGEALG